MKDSGPADEPREASSSGHDQLLDAAMRLAYDDSGDDATPSDQHKSVIETLRTAMDTEFCEVSLKDLDQIDSPIHLPRGGRVGSTLPPQVGHYRVAGEIARGGVGVVYRARDEDLGRDVAIKVLHEAYGDNVQMTSRFVEEAQVGGQLQHPGIVPVHELGLLAGKRPYFAMKLVKGETLSRLLERRASASEDRLRFLGIFEQVCRPIAYAHARGVIHRDLKPSNIMVGAFGEVQVMDWGLAKVLSHGGVADERVGTNARKDVSIVETVRSGSTGSESLAGSILGTLAYMPPEQARGEVDSLDESSDVFGLGAILCEILTGEPPYTGPTTREVRRRAERGEIEEAMERLDACGADSEVIALAKRCLALSPRERPLDGAAVADEIAEYLESLEAKARASQIRAAEAEIRTREERKARRLTLALAVTVVVGLLGAGGGYLWLEREQRESARLASARVNAVLDDARRLHATALASGGGQEQWAAALESAKAARSLITVDTPPDLRAVVEQFGFEVERDSRVRRLEARLEEIRDEPTFHRFATSALGIDQYYGEAFDEFLGGQLLDLPRADVVERLNESGIAKNVARSLDDWALVRRKLGRSWEPVVDIALLVDPDRARERLWAVVRSASDGDLEEIIKSLSADEVSARYLCALAQFWGSGQGPDQDAAETLLKRAVKLEPNSFRANALYGSLLERTNRHAESLVYLAAARALRPQNPLVSYELGLVYTRLEDFDAALESFSRSFGVLPHGWIIQGPQELLEREDVEISSEVLDEYIQAIRDVPEAEKNVVRRIYDLMGAALALRYRGEDSETGIAMAMAEVQRTRRGNPHVLAMLARVQSAAGRRAAAVRTLEEAMSLPRRRWMYGIPPEDLLEEYRSAMHPKIVSYASLEAALGIPAASGDEALSIDVERLPEVRSTLERQGAANLLTYLDGRRLQASGHQTAAAERFLEVLAMDREAPEPFVRLWESLRETIGVDAANRRLRAEIARGRPFALVPIPPQVPNSLEAIAGGTGVRLCASEFRCADPEVQHDSTRWEVRAADGEFGRTPVVDLATRKDLTCLQLPRHRLRPKTRYVWRVSYVSSAGRTVTSAEASFETPDYAFEAVPIDLTAHFNRDVVVDSGDEHNDTVDDGQGALVEEGLEGAPDVRGLPRNGRVGVHRLASYDGLNAVQMTSSSIGEIRVDVPPQRYMALRFVVTGGHGDSDVPVTFVYEDGTSRRGIIRCDDWIDGPDGGLWGGVREGVQPILDGMGCFRGRDSLSGREYALFEFTIEVDPRRALRAFVLHSSEMKLTYDRTRFNLLAATGIVIGE